MNRFIEPTVRARIHRELDAIERRESVRILLAVESGSRAWGFPSRDSDYDVRFLYVRPIETYLAVTARRDVIEQPIDATLDINGWDLRKALRLMLRSNAVLIEWLTSPLRYRNWERADELVVLARSAASPTALTYHYQHQARRSFDTVGEVNSVRIKSYCYALRSALAIAWIHRSGEAPPMDIEAADGRASPVGGTGRVCPQNDRTKAGCGRGRDDAALIGIRCVHRRCSFGACCGGRGKGLYGDIGSGRRVPCSSAPGSRHVSLSHGEPRRLTRRATKALYRGGGRLNSAALRPFSVVLRETLAVP